MKRLLVIAALSGCAGWLYVKSEKATEDSAASSNEEDASKSQHSAQRHLRFFSSDKKLFEATQKLAASDFSDKYTNGQNQGYKNFDSFFQNKQGGRAALDFIDGGGSEDGTIPDDIFSLMTDSLAQISIQEDLETRLKILNLLGKDGSHKENVKMLSLRELFTKVPHQTAERDPNEHQRSLAAYEAFLATQPNPDEILRVTVDAFYFNEDDSLNQEMKSNLSSKFPDLIPKLESRYRDPASTAPPADPSDPNAAPAEPEVQPGVQSEGPGAQEDPIAPPPSS